ncbi:MAG: MOSC N-terminal beta barrel domain-containing protein [Myxococcota bacterium]
MSALYRYPVKSLRGVPLREAEVEARGLAGDRRWMIVDAHGVFLSQRTLPELARVVVDTSDAGITLRTPDGSQATLPWSHEGPEEPVTVWRDTLPACAHAEGSALLSTFLGRPVRLVHQAGRRATSRGGGEVSFADAYPLLLTTTASHAALDQEAGTAMDPRRFRPNIVVANDTPWVEDRWKSLTLGAVPFEGVKGCDRCVLTTVHPETGRKGAEPLRTLARTRRHEGKVWFGMNLIPRGTGRIAHGDELRVTSLHNVAPRE